MHKSDKKVAFITGVGGQDGYYLSRLLLNNGYEVHGGVRKTNTIDGLDGVKLHQMDVTDRGLVRDVIMEICPDEIYHLAAQSHVGYSFECPDLTWNVNFGGTINVLEAARTLLGRGVKLYHASTSEMFGDNIPESGADENCSFSPRSPYAASKVAAHHEVIRYREQYGMFNCCGILFNHESPRRGENFVTRKITLGLARILKDKSFVLRLGNMDTMRDWGFAGDYVKAMHWMMTSSCPIDYVVSTGKSHSVREFLEESIRCVESNDKRVDRSRITCGSGMRPLDVKRLMGDSTRIKTLLGWNHHVGFKRLVEMMVNSDVFGVTLTENLSC